MENLNRIGLALEVGVASLLMTSMSVAAAPAALLFVPAAALASVISIVADKAIKNILDLNSREIGVKFTIKTVSLIAGSIVSGALLTVAIAPSLSTFALFSSIMFFVASAGALSFPTLRFVQQCRNGNSYSPFFRGFYD